MLRLVQDFPVGYHPGGVTGGAEGDDSYAPFFLLASFQALRPVALTGDVDGQRGVLPSVAVRVGNEFGSVDQPHLPHQRQT
jgi:hypothetical protein